MWDEFIKYMSGLGGGGGGASSAVPNSYKVTPYSTVAPQEWLDAVSAQPGFNPLGSGGGMSDVIGTGTLGGAAKGISDPTFMQGLTGYTDAKGNQVNGWGGVALGAVQGLGGAYLGMKQFQLAQDTLKENKRQFEMNYGAQRQLTNSSLEDRQRARVASNAGAYESVDAYMNKNRVH